MKRIIALILVISLCTVFLSSCSEDFDLQAPFLVAVGIILFASHSNAQVKVSAFNTFYDNEFLLECNLSDMPLPNLEGSALSEGNVVHLNMTDDEYIAYCQEIYNYLLSKEDAYFQGYNHSTGGKYFYPLNDEYTTTLDANSFVFSLTEKLNNYRDGDIFVSEDRYSNPVIIEISREDKTLKKGFKKYQYNTSIKIKLRPIVGCHYNGELQDGSALSLAN